MTKVPIEIIENLHFSQNSDGETSSTLHTVLNVKILVFLKNI